MGLIWFVLLFYLFFYLLILNKYFNKYAEIDLFFINLRYFYKRKVFKMKLSSSKFKLLIISAQFILPTIGLIYSRDIKLLNYFNQVLKYLMNSISYIGWLTPITMYITLKEILKLTQSELEIKINFSFIKNNYVKLFIIFINPILTYNTFMFLYDKLNWNTWYFNPITVLILFIILVVSAFPWDEKCDECKNKDSNIVFEDTKE